MIAAERGTIWRPYTQHGSADPPLFIEKAEGSTLYAKDGRRIFDAISSWWVNIHGHSHPKIAAAVAEQARTLDQVIFASCTHEPAERLADALVRAAPKGLDRVFFSDDGSTAVEAAVKLAVSFWRRRGEGRRTLIALENAYHGDTFGAMSVSAPSAFTADYAGMLFDVKRVPWPAPGREKESLDTLEKLLRSERRRAAAMIVEPLVMGASGMLMYGAASLKAMREACARHGVLFIADEVMTGFGRTGTLFACGQAGISPDILCLSKGITGGFLPLGATLAMEEVFRAFASEDRSRTFFHGHSYTGNPLSCAAAVASLSLFEEESTLSRIERIAGIHKRELKRFIRRKEVADARQTGTIAAVELRVPDAGYLSELGPKLSRFYLSRGVLLRPLGNVVYILPPYCSTEAELVRAYDAIEESLKIVGL